ncbi:MAG: hypothetical protein JWN02_824, partial [Acidobacteria bacterium]|nr:hypothetical protein [Acidobacteriota bacterium]
MTSSMDDPATSIPPRSEPAPLRGRIVPVAALTVEEREGMFALFARY